MRKTRSFRESWLTRVRENNDSGSIDLLSFDADADWHVSMRRKYVQAARYPWLSVPSDPPEPK